MLLVNRFRKILKLKVYQRNTLNPVVPSPEGGDSYNFFKLQMPGNLYRDIAWEVFENEVRGEIINPKKTEKTPHL